MKVRTKFIPGTNRAGRPKTFRPQLEANTSTARAVAALARQGAAHHNALAGMKHAPRRTLQTGDRKWVGAEELAQILMLGGKDAFNRMAIGGTSVALDKAVSCVRELIKGGLLDCLELDAVPLTLGHSRALHPFRPVFAELRATGRFQVPSRELAERVDQLAHGYRVAIASRAKAESEERTSVRAARACVVRTLLELQIALRRDSMSADVETTEAVATSIESLLAAIEDVDFGVCEVALSPREAGAQFARQFMAPMGEDGGPDFAGMFKAAMMDAVDAGGVRAEAIDQLARRVSERWGSDADLGDWREAVPNWRLFDLVVPARGKPRRKPRIALARRWRRRQSVPTGRPRAKAMFQYPQRPSALGSVLASRFGDLPERDLKFLRRLSRAGAPYNPRFLLALALAEAWYFDDEQPDCRQTEFESRLDAVRRWARSVTSRATPSGLARSKPSSGGGALLVAPTMAEIKRLIQDLMRLDVRPMVEMNIDMPEPIDVESLKG